MSQEREELQEVHKIDTMPSAEREKALIQRLQKALQHFYNNAPAIKELFDRVGVKPSDINSISDLARIPVTTKDQMKEMQQQNPPFGGFLAIPPEQIARIYMSPGPLYEPAARTAAGGARGWLAEAGFQPGDIVMNSFSYHLVPAGLGVDDGIVAMGATVMPAGIGNTDLQVQIMKDLKVTGYFGTPSFLWTLIKRAEEHGYDFRRDFSLKVAVLGAEMVPPSMKKTFKEDYGIEPVENYGTAELGIVGLECSANQGLHVVGNKVVEFVDPTTGEQVGPGEPGEVVVTTFEEAYALVRFGTGDLAIYTDEPCPCGRTSPRITRIVGRVGDSLKVRGMFVHGGQVGQVVSSFPELGNFQAIIERFEQRDHLTINVELVDEKADKAKLLDAFNKSFQDKCRVRADKVEFLAKGSIPADAKKLDDRRTWD